MATIPAGTEIQTYDLDFTGAQVNETIGFILNGGVNQAVTEAQEFASAAEINANAAANSASAAASSEVIASGAAAQATTYAEAAAAKVEEADGKVQEAAAKVEEAEGKVQDAEAWAIGQRNGVDVGNGDETYQNNAKYYAQIAAGSVAGVASFNGRSGIVTAQSGDYTADQVGAIPNPAEKAAGQSLVYNGSAWVAQDGALPADTSPVMDGTATAGTSLQYARADHVHPTDTSKANVSDIPSPSSSTPVMDGAASAGSAIQYARADHVHPTDSTRQPAGDYVTESQLGARSGVATLDEYGYLTPKQSFSRSVEMTTSTTITPDVGGCCLMCTNTEAITLTIFHVPNLYPIMQEFEVCNLGGGQITIQAPSDVAINGVKGGSVVLSEQYKSIVFKWSQFVLSWVAQGAIG